MLIKLFYGWIDEKGIFQLTESAPAEGIYYEKASMDIDDEFYAQNLQIFEQIVRDATG